MSVEKKHSPFSVCMSVYKNDKLADVRTAIESITVKQTLQPTEVVLVVDGPIPDDMNNVLVEFENNYPTMFNIIRLPENKGLGNALKVAVENAKYEIIARMDSDDISLPERFEKQISYMQEHPECDLVGGQISEFIESESNVVGNRIVPCRHEEIIMWLKGRCPFNHMSVMLLRSRVLAVGNYQDWFWNEDYYLWIRMALADYRFANLPDTLVTVRVGRDMYKRRGGRKYFESEKGLQQYMHKHGLISWPRMCYNIFGRYVIQILMPNSVRGFIFRKMFRK